MLEDTGDVTGAGNYTYFWNGYPQGWICPRCGKVFSPDTEECSYCNAEKDWSPWQPWYPPYIPPYNPPYYTDNPYYIVTVPSNFN